MADVDCAAPPSREGGWLYVAPDGSLHYLGAGGTDTQLTPDVQTEA